MNKIINRLLVVATLFIVFSCNDDFLERVPEDQMTDENFFYTANDYKVYANGLYSGVIRNIMSQRWQIEDGSDNVVKGNSPNGALMQHGNAGVAPDGSGFWNGSYDYIRSVNYMLDNRHKISIDDKIAQHYIGEAFFCRASKYFDLLKVYGGVPFIAERLNVDSEELTTKRLSRNELAAKIIQDLDSAIVKLNWKRQGEAKSGRINKEAALLLKTRVGLYEGSWEYYHGRKNTLFAVSGEDGSALLDKVIEAGDQLIAHQAAKIYVGKTGFEYEDLFNKEDYYGVDGAFLYKHFDFDAELAHNAYRDMAPGFSHSPTKSAIDCYLMSDGKPEGLSSVTYDRTNQNSLLRSRDPRLVQTVYPPDRGDYRALVNNMPVDNLYAVIYPDLNMPYVPNGSGYRVIKGMAYTTISLDINETDDLDYALCRGVVETMLKRKAIKGTITQGDIDKTVNVLRGRVGMAPMNLGEINGWGVTYEAKYGYDPSASATVNEIRRERRVELMLEGFRRDDLKRWACYEEVINGYMPRGAYFDEIYTYYTDKDILMAAGMTEAVANDRMLNEGVNCERNGDYVRCFFPSCRL